MTGPSTWSFVHEDGQVLRPDPARVVAKTFLPGQEIEGSGRSRATAVLDRVLAIPDDEVTGLLAATMNSYGPRHGDLATLLEDRFELVAHRLVGRGLRIQAVGAGLEMASQPAARHLPAAIDARPPCLCTPGHDSLLGNIPVHQFG
mgnify:CR=1 FL=1